MMTMMTVVDYLNTSRGAAPSKIWHTSAATSCSDSGPSCRLHIVDSSTCRRHNRSQKDAHKEADRFALYTSWLETPAGCLCCVIGCQDLRCGNTDYWKSHAAGTSATPPAPPPGAAAAAAGRASRPLAAVLASAWTAGICGGEHNVLLLEVLHTASMLGLQPATAQAGQQEC
jgi:hypothetical protein